MAQFVVETYVPREDAGALDRRAERLRRAAAQVARERGTEIRLTWRLYVPSDETCLLLFEADAIEAVQEAAGRAGVPCERVAAAVTG